MFWCNGLNLSTVLKFIQKNPTRCNSV